MNKTIRMAAIGAGYWGPNLIRNFVQLEGVELRAICDQSEEIREKMAKQYPFTTATNDVESLIADPEIAAVCIATPAPTHAELAIKFLEAGKDVFVEKPMALKTADARRILETAEKNKRVCMVGHLLEYHPNVNQVKGYLENGELGDLFYLYCQRVNLGKVRSNENALWSLAPHDISVLLYLTGRLPVSVSAQGQCYLQKDKGIEDVVFYNVRFADGLMAQGHVSWLDPHKIRRFTLVGSKKMVVLDDSGTEEPIRIYDKGFDTHRRPFETYGEFLRMRNGDVVIPKVQNVEPLRVECQHFIDCVRERKTPRSDARDGVRVVAVLEALSRSLEESGAVIPVEDLS